MSKDTAKRTIAVVAEFKEMSEDEISLDTSLEKMEMDSLDALSLVFELEEEFDIMIPDDKAFEMKTIGEMVKGIDKLLELKEAEEKGDSSSKEASDSSDKDLAAADG